MFTAVHHVHVNDVNVAFMSKSIDRNLKNNWVPFNHWKAFNLEMPDLNHVLHHGKAPILGYKDREYNCYHTWHGCFVCFPAVLIQMCCRHARATFQGKSVRMSLARDNAKPLQSQALHGCWVPSPSHRSWDKVSHNMDNTMYTCRARHPHYSDQKDGTRP